MRKAATSMLGTQRITLEKRRPYAEDSTHFASGSKGQPTFLNLDEPYPKEIFTILIWGSDRPKFGHPEETYRDKSVCVTGKTTNHRGVPEIAASEPGQIESRK